MKKKQFSDIVKFVMILLFIGLLLTGCGVLTSAGTSQSSDGAEGWQDLNGQDADPAEKEENEESSDQSPAAPDAGSDGGGKGSSEDAGSEDDLAPGKEDDASQNADPDHRDPAAGSGTSGKEPATGSVERRPYYTLEGDPPTAPGLVMAKRQFSPEPQKIAYLTFDDGPHPRTTPQILKILQEEQVPATFFVIGYLAERYPDLLQAEYDAGHAIGNHSYSHNYDAIYQSPQAFLEDIKTAEKVIAGITGEAPRIIRAPGGTQTHFGVDYYNLLDSHDYLVFDWNVSIGDTAAPLVPRDTLLANLKKQVPGKNRVIILMHDAGGKTTTVEALPEIIKYLKANGFAFGVLSPQVRPILFPGGFTN